MLVHGTTWDCTPGAVQSSALHLRYRFLTPDPQVTVHLLNGPHWNVPWLWMVLALLLLKSLACCLFNTVACWWLSVMGSGRSGCTCSCMGNSETGKWLFWFVTLMWVWIWYGRGALSLNSTAFAWEWGGSWTVGGGCVFVFPAVCVSGGLAKFRTRELPFVEAAAFPLDLAGSSATLKDDSLLSLTSTGLKLWP